MRLGLWCVWTGWIFSLHAAAQHPPDREEGGVQPGRSSSPTPLRLDVRKPETVRGARGKAGGRRAALDGPRVCGARCCVGWTLSPKTRRCTKPRCLPRCHNNALCRQSNRCVCRRGFRGYRCEVSMVTFPPSGHPLTSARPTRPEPGATTENSRPEPGSSAPQTSTPGSSGPDPFGHVGVKMDNGANELFEMQEQNRASTKRTGEPLRPRRGEPEDTVVGQSPKSKSDPEPKIASGSQTQEGPHVDSVSWSKTDGNMSLDPKESLIQQTEDGSTRSRSKEEDGTGPGPQDGLSLESGPGLDGQKSEDDLTREKKTQSSNGPGGQRSLDVTGEKKKKKKQTLR